MDLSHRTIAVVAGDEREQEIARLAAATGATVRAFGFPWPGGGIPGVERSASLIQALADAHYALFPIPGITADGGLFAPEHGESIIPDSDALSVMRPGARIILGWPDEKLSHAADVNGLGIDGYEEDQELMLLRGPSIVEGALELSIKHTDISIHGASIAVIGHGNIGRLLARTLVLLGGQVTVFARNPVQRADALTAGSAAAPLTELLHRAPYLEMVFATVPAPIVTREVIAALPPSSFLMDLAAPPGGIDAEAAKATGHTHVWARGMGRRAPVTVGRSQWQGILQRILENERALNSA